MELGIAVASGIGGIAVRSSSIHAVSWIGAASVTIAVIIAAVSFNLNSKVTKYEEKQEVF